MPTHSSLRAVTAVRSYTPRSLAAVVLGIKVVTGTDTGSPECLLRPVVSVGGCVNPMLDAYLLRIGATRTDRRTYHLPLGRNGSVENAVAGLRAVRASVRYTALDVADARRRGVELSSLRRSKVEENIRQELSKNATLLAAWDASGDTSRPRRDRTRGGVVIHVGRSELKLTIITDQFGKNFQGMLPDSVDLGAFDTLRPGATLPEVLLHPDEVVALVEQVSTDDINIVDMGSPARWAEIVDLSLGSVVVRSVTGAPGLADVHVGGGVEDIPILPGPRRTSEALAVVGAHHLMVPVAVNDSVVELAEMSMAGAMGRTGLLPHQDQFCSVYAAARHGVVNAMAPGMGKTVSSAAALRERSRSRDSWRGLITVPAGLRQQWHSEMGRFFPEALCVVLASEKDAQTLTGVLSAAQERPVAVIISHEGVGRYQEVLQATSWDDMVCDEAVVLRSRTSNRSRALWDLRRHSRRGIALTGTPVEKDMQDLAHLVAWATLDVAVEGATDIADTMGMSLEDVLGGSVFRRTLAEISGRLPSVDVSVSRHQSGKHHRILLNHLHASFTQEVALLSQHLEDGRKSEAARTRAKALNMLTTLRAATADPSGVLGSEARIITELPPQVLSNALREGGAKVRSITELARERSGEGGRILVCTDFPSAARSLREACEEAGLRSLVLSGSQSPTERTLAAAAFTEGEVDVLCLSGAGRLGLNLQAATDVVHLDLPLSATQVTQRTARAVRLGSSHSDLRVHVPLLEGSIDPHLFSALEPALDRMEDLQAEDELESGIVDLTGDTSLQELAATL